MLSGNTELIINYLIRCITVIMTDKSNNIMRYVNQLDDRNSLISNCLRYTPSLE